MAAACLLAACGGASHTTSSSSGSPGPTGTAPTGAATTAAPTVAAPTAATPAASKARFLTLANFVCRTVRTGAPLPLPANASRAMRTDYFPRAKLVAQRTLVSLQRLQARAPRQISFEPLIAGYRSLVPLYAESLDDASVARRIPQTETQVSAAARSLSLPNCAPRPAGG